MGLLDFFRRKKRPSGPNLKDIWRGFQQVLALNNEIQVLMGYLEEKLAAAAEPDLDTWRVRIDLLDRRFADLGAALQGMVGGRWQELEVAQTRVREAIYRRLAQPNDPEKFQAVLDLITPLTLHGPPQPRLPPGELPHLPRYHPLCP